MDNTDETENSKKKSSDEIWKHPRCLQHAVSQSVPRMARKNSGISRSEQECAAKNTDNNEGFVATQDTKANWMEQQAFKTSHLTTSNQTERSDQSEAVASHKISMEGEAPGAEQIMDTIHNSHMKKKFVTANLPKQKPIFKVNDLAKSISAKSTNQGKKYVRKGSSNTTVETSAASGTKFNIRENHVSQDRIQSESDKTMNLSYLLEDATCSNLKSHHLQKTPAETFHHIQETPAKDDKKRVHFLN
jgi:hypothetical protein